MFDTANAARNKSIVGQPSSNRDAALIIRKMIVDARELLQAAYYSFKLNESEVKGTERVVRDLERLELKFDTAWYRDMGQAKPSPYLKRPRETESA